MSAIASPFWDTLPRLKVAILILFSVRICVILLITPTLSFVGYINIKIS